MGKCDRINGQFNKLSSFIIPRGAMAEIITNYIAITNTITATNSITSLQDPSLWISLIGGTATLASAFLMWKSVNEMKLQRQLEYKKLELSQLRNFIAENLSPYVKEYKQGKYIKSDKLDVKLIEHVNHHLYLGLMQLGSFSQNTFYEKDITTLSLGIARLYGFTEHPDYFSYRTKLDVSLILTKVCDNIYRSLTDKQALAEILVMIQEESNSLHKRLTDAEKEATEKLLYKYAKATGLL